MKFLKKSIFSVAAIVLLMTGIFVAVLPAVSAHDPPWTIPTYAYVSASPDTIGLGDYTLIVAWTDKYPLTAGGTGGDRWRGFTLDVTKPDGTKETIPMGQTSQVASAFVVYTPTQVGNYTIVFSWPGQTLTNGTGTPRVTDYVGDHYLGATSNPATLRVTQQQTPQWQEPPLPDYWMRPIPTANRNWAQLASNWLKGSWLEDNVQPWGIAPNTAHILYAKEILNGGISDESHYAVKYDTTDYENFFSAPIIMSGKIFYNSRTYPNYGYTAVDLRTGELVWEMNGTENGMDNLVIEQVYQGLGGAGVYTGQTFPELSFGQLYHYRSLNGEGVKDHLWITQSGTPQTNRTGGTMWYLLDANTGRWVMSLKNVPGGTSVTDADGDILLYTYSSGSGRYLAWNVTQSIGPPSPTGTGQEQWEPRIGHVLDAVNDRTWQEFGTRGGTSPIDADDIRPRSGYTMNVTGPTGLPGLSRIMQDENREPRMFLHSTFNSATETFRVAAVRIDYNVAPYSPLPEKTYSQNNNLGFGVTLLWEKTYQAPRAGNLTLSLGSASFVDGIFTVESKETMQLWGYSLTTGEQVWGPTAPQNDWNMYGITGNVAYGRIYATGYSGILYCYDIKNGSLLWTYEAPGIGNESPYGDYPLSIGAIADGKVFLYSTEHSPTQPLWRGSYLRAVDAFTGQEMWKALNFVSGMAVADGCVVAGNSYDNRMYVYGKGPSATTVSVGPKVIAKGGSVIIEGAVTDQSPGAVGSPAIADEYMDEWMDYLYMKQIKPENIMGVDVHLTAIDPNGNLQDIGVVQCDENGVFSSLWQPPVEGKYAVYADFEGSEAYGSSSAQTAFGVTLAPAASPGASPTPSETASPTVSPSQSAQPSPSPTTVPPPGEETSTAIYIAIGAAVIIVVGVAAALVLRRRK